jgi:hypothetical protein
VRPVQGQVVPQTPSPAARLSICVQHHPARALPAQLAAYEVVEDPDPDAAPSAIRCYMECLRRTPPGATHRLVLQDDVELVSDFAQRAAARAAEMPAEVIAFFVPNFALHGKWMRDALDGGKRWCSLPSSANWAPAVATCWPVADAADFLAYAAAHVGKRRERGLQTIGDDPVIGAWKRARKRTIWATVPSLAQHPDVGYSLVKLKTYDGQNRARQAAVFVAD